MAETADNSDMDCAAEESLPNELPSDLEELKKLPQIKVKKGFRWVNSGCSQEGMGQGGVKKGWVKVQSRRDGSGSSQEGMGQGAVKKGWVKVQSRRDGSRCSQEEMGQGAVKKG